MKVSLEDSSLLRTAARAVVALNSHAEKKDDVKGVHPCLLTARGGQLVVESSVSGLYLTYVIKDVKVTQEGQFAMNASLLKNIPEGQSVSLIRSSKGELQVKLKHSTYRLREADNVTEIVSSGRIYDKRKIKKNLATLPFRLLKEAVNQVTFKSANTADSFRLQISISDRELECVGVDTFTNTRVVIKDKKIKAARPLQAILKEGVLKVLTNEMSALSEDEMVTVGLQLDSDKQPQAFYFSTSCLELWYPTVGSPVKDYAAAVKSLFKNAPPVVKFSAMGGDLRSALSTVTALCQGWDPDEDHLEFTANEGAVSLSATTSTVSSDTVISTDGEITVQRKAERGSKAERVVRVPQYYIDIFFGLIGVNTLAEVIVCGEVAVYIKMNIDNKTAVGLLTRQESPDVSPEEGK